MPTPIDPDVLLLAQTLGRHAQHAYSTGLELRRALVEHDAVGLFQRHQGYLTGTAEQIIISFAGSRSAESTFGLVDWCDNLTARLDEHACGRVHSGCHRQVQFYLKEEMLRGLEKLYTGQTILLTGHSRGGALALLAAHELQQAGFQQVAVFMFGAPKVGDQTFADSCGFPVYRIECEGDPVPLLPPLEGYVAVGSSIWLADDGRIHTSQAPIEQLVRKGISWGDRILQIIRQQSLSTDMLTHHGIECYLDRLKNGKIAWDEQ